MSEILPRRWAVAFDRDPASVLSTLGGRFTRAGAGAILIRQGYLVDEVSCLLEGTVKVEASDWDDKILLICFSKPPTFFGDVETFRDEPTATCTITAVTEVRLWHIDRERLRLRLGEHPEVAALLARGLAEKLAARAQEAARALLSPLSVRYESYLAEMGANQAAVPIHLEETAARLATSPRHLQRVIRDLVNQGKVERRGRALLRIDGTEDRVDTAPLWENQDEPLGSRPRSSGTGVAEAEE